MWYERRTAHRWCLVHIIHRLYTAIHKQSLVAIDYTPTTTAAQVELRWTISPQIIDHLLSSTSSSADIWTLPALSTTLILNPLILSDHPRYPRLYHHHQPSSCQVQLETCTVFPQPSTPLPLASSLQARRRQTTRNTHPKSPQLLNDQYVATKKNIVGTYQKICCSVVNLKLWQKNDPLSSCPN